jgi:hypothetical protein
LRILDEHGQLLTILLEQGQHGNRSRR